jgi:hypothetical protein
MDLSLINEYISGKKFTNSLYFKTASFEKSIQARMETIENTVKNKRIVHFGCADHVDIIESKIKKNIWFHKRLMECTTKCTGIDNNKHAVDFLRQNLHIPDIYCLDILKDNIPNEITNEKYDFLIMGEIIEHIDNPVSFLQAVHMSFKNCTDSIIITAPNAFRWLNFRFALKHTEIINSDHRYWFTVYTLSKLLQLAGYKSIKYQFVESYMPGKWALRKNIILRLFPMMRDTVLINASF